MRIELTQSAWKADILPLNYTRILQGASFLTFALPLGYCSLRKQIGFEPTIESIFIKKLLFAPF